MRRTAHGAEGLEAEHRPRPSFDASVIRLHEFVEILCLAELDLDIAAVTERFHLSKVGNAPVDRHDPRLAILDAGPPQEPVSSICNMLRCEKEIHGLPAPVDGPVGIFPFAANLQVGLIHPPAIAALVAPNGLLQFRRVSSYLTGDSAVIDGQAPFADKLLDIVVANSIAQILANGRRNDPLLEGTALE